MAGQPRAKLFYKIGEVSRLADVEPYILRYWESEFPALSPRKNQGGQRVYQQKDLELVLLIKKMLHDEGYTIAGARKLLSGKGGTVSGPGGMEGLDAADGQGSELADALGRFKKEIKDILDLIR
jgi:DNA-binding transcriptional MerR regulator